MMRNDLRAKWAAFATASVAGWGAFARGEQVVIPPSRDNTLYEHALGAISNGAGQHLFAGRTGIFDGTRRRALVAFDLAGYIPAGATIDSVTLTLNMSKTNVDAGNQPVNLHRVLADWGEGTSDAAGDEGQGAAATPGDATWQHTFFNTSFWTVDGGDFSSTISAGRAVGGVGFYTWGPTSELRDDVQGWLDQPATNFGWLLRGNEAVITTAKRFDSRENPIATNRPVLVVDFTPPSIPGDFDRDGDVDGDDYIEFSACLSGPGGGVAEGCDPGDADADGDIDLADFASFQAVFIG